MVSNKSLQPSPKLCLKCANKPNMTWAISLKAAAESVLPTHNRWLMKTGVFICFIDGARYVEDMYYFFKCLSTDKDSSWNLIIEVFSEVQSVSPISGKIEVRLD